MKTGTPIHVGGGLLVHLCHAVAYIPGHSGVMWHTEEDGYVLLTHDVNGHLKSQLIIDEAEFLEQNPYKMLLPPRRQPGPSFFAVLLETALKKTEPK